MQLSEMNTEQLTKFRDDVKAEYVAHRNKKKHEEIYRRVKNGDITILYLSPERYNDIAFRNAICYHEPWLIVIDEAHCYIEWGRSFRTDYKKIPKETLINSPSASAGKFPPALRCEILQSTKDCRDFAP